MKALLIEAPDQITFTDVEIPTPGPNEVLCRVRAVSICGTDSHLIHGEYPGFWPPSFPFTPGHEWAGEVAGIGYGTDLLGWSVGDRVAGTSHAPCGYCPRCIEGRYNLCLNYGNPALHKHYGHNWTGAYSEYVVHNVKSVFHLPDELSYYEGALLDPASISLHAANRGGNQPGDTVVIFGPGPIGLLASEAARVRGAAKVIVAGLGSKDEGRLKKALELGNVIIDLEKEDPNSIVRELTGGVGADVVIDCAGAPASIRSSLSVLRRGGRCAAVGIPLQEVNLPVQDLVLNELELVGVRGSAGEMRTVIPLVATEKIRVKPLITHIFPMSSFCEALETFSQQRDGAIKVIVEP